MKTNGTKVLDTPGGGDVSIISEETRKTFSLVPTTMDEALKYAEMISKSSLVPDVFKGKAPDILIAVQMGMEIGLKPLQALQNIAVINGRPTLWGDAVLAIVKASGTVERFTENWDEKTKTAICKARRKGDQDEIVRTFSMDDAKAAGLAGKQGTWQNYPKRMCQMRARSWALRDGWADVLKGFQVAEEVQDFDVTNTHEAEIVAETPEVVMPVRASEKKSVEQVGEEAFAVPADPVNAPGVTADPVPEKPAEPELVQRVVQVGVKQVFVKDGVDNNNKGWRRWRIEGIDGQNYFTFSESFYKIATEAKKSGSVAEIRFHNNPAYGNQVDAITLVSDAVNA
jgi:hypothetical protein